MERLNPVQTQDGGAYLPKGQQLLLQYLAKLRLLEALRNKKLEFILTLDQEKNGQLKNLSNGEKTLLEEIKRDEEITRTSREQLQFQPALPVQSKLQQLVRDCYKKWLIHACCRKPFASALIKK